MRGFYKFKKRVISEGFDVVVEQDFNPDFVFCFGFDCFDQGMIFGVLVGASTVAAAFGIAKLVKKKGENNGYFKTRA